MSRLALVVAVGVVAIGSAGSAADAPRQLAALAPAASTASSERVGLVVLGAAEANRTLRFVTGPTDRLEILLPDGGSLRLARNTAIQVVAGAGPRMALQVSGLSGEVRVAAAPGGQAITVSTPDGSSQFDGGTGIVAAQNGRTVTLLLFGSSVRVSNDGGSSELTRPANAIVTGRQAPPSRQQALAPDVLSAYVAAVQPGPNESVAVVQQLAVRRVPDSGSGAEQQGRGEQAIGLAPAQDQSVVPGDNQATSGHAPGGGATAIDQSSPADTGRGSAGRGPSGVALSASGSASAGPSVTTSGTTTAGPGTIAGLSDTVGQNPTSGSGGTTNVGTGPPLTNQSCVAAKTCGAPTPLVPTPSATLSSSLDSVPTQGTLAPLAATTGSATYTGTVVPSSAAITGGPFSLSWDYAARKGSFTAGLDNRTYTGPATSNATGKLSGTTTPVGGYSLGIVAQFYGSGTGNVVPEQVYGNFNATGPSNYSVSGTVNGSSALPATLSGSPALSMLPYQQLTNIGSATYTGTVQPTTTGTGGAFGLNWNFGARNGTFNAMLDDVKYNGTATMATTGATASQIAGTSSGNGRNFDVLAQFYGQAGTRVTPSQVFGNFLATGTNYKVSGTVSGTKQ